MVIYLFFVGVLVISKCRKQEQKGLKTVILALKILGDLKVFLLVIGDLRNRLVMVILAIFWWWYGDLSHFLLVIWWLVPEKIGDLVILRSYGDGDLPIFRWYFCD